MNLPGPALRAFGGDIPASGLAVEATLNPARCNVSRARVQVNIPRAGFFNLDVAAARPALYRARDLMGPHVARAGLQANLAAEIGKLQIARTGLEVDIAVRAFNGLISEPVRERTTVSAGTLIS